MLTMTIEKAKTCDISLFKWIRKFLFEVVEGVRVKICIKVLDDAIK